LRLPEADAAIIPAEKLRDYVLSPTHPVGRFKAAFFAELGYRQSDWPRLEADLRAQHLPLDVEGTERTPYGVKHRVRGPLEGPSGRTADVVAIWIVRSGERAPRLVTLFPGGKQ